MLREMDKTVALHSFPSQLTGMLSIGPFINSLSEMYLFTQSPPPPPNCYLARGPGQWSCGGPTGPAAALAGAPSTQRWNIITVHLCFVQAQPEI